jgi:hypothetical protein
MASDYALRSHPTAVPKPPSAHRVIADGNYYPFIKLSPYSSASCSHGPPARHYTASSSMAFQANVLRPVIKMSNQRELFEGITTQWKVIGSIYRTSRHCQLWGSGSIITPNGSLHGPSTTFSHGIPIPRQAGACRATGPTFTPT